MLPDGRPVDAREVLVDDAVLDVEFASGSEDLSEPSRLAGPIEVPIDGAMRFEGLEPWFDGVRVGTSVTDLRDGWWNFDERGLRPLVRSGVEVALELRVARAAELALRFPLAAQTCFVDFIALVDPATHFVVADRDPYTIVEDGCLVSEFERTPAGTFRLQGRVVDRTGRAWIVDQVVVVAADERTVVDAAMLEGASVDAVLPPFDPGGELARLGGVGLRPSSPDDAYRVEAFAVWTRVDLRDAWPGERLRASLRGLLPDTEYVSVPFGTHVRTGGAGSTVDAEF
ncbi:MAG: hypothetical protein R3F34_19825 [Planctomycetota bacterium]